MIIFLASSKRGDFISNEDLIECQKQWLEMMKGQSRETKTGERRALCCKSGSVSLLTGNTELHPEYSSLGSLPCIRVERRRLLWGKAEESRRCAILQSPRLQETDYPVFWVWLKI